MSADPLPPAAGARPTDLLQAAMPATAVSTAALAEAVRTQLSTRLPAESLPTPWRAEAEWTLCHQGLLDEAEILQAYAATTGIPVLDEAELDQVDRYPGLSFAYLSQWLCLPVGWDNDTMALVVATPYHLAELTHHWCTLLHRQPRFYLGRRSLVERLLAAHYDQTPASGNRLAGDATSEEALRDLASEAPIVRLVNDMFARALEMNASDIHVEPGEKELVIRFRIDGVLRPVLTPPLASYPAIASRLKLLGGLNIAERRLPQDGRTDLRLGRGAVDVRLSTVPAMHGESIVLRLLRKDLSRFSLGTIGMDARLQQQFGQLVEAPHGMVLVVGPTGSGKTTTLYCAMNLLNSPDKKIITIEDPIEYQIPGVTQMQVKPAIGLTFANGLRHIVRQDPDIILIGEIRDKETAEIAVHAALTGHLVLSTLHTNDAVGAVSRLLDMGVEGFLLSSALIGVMSQRLVRRICTTCGGTGQLVESAGTKACRKCTGSGFSDRVGIFEFLRIEEEFRGAIRTGSDSSQLNAIARRHGMLPLRDAGDAAVATGITTAGEVARVCQSEG